ASHARARCMSAHGIHDNQDRRSRVSWPRSTATRSRLGQHGEGDHRNDHDLASHGVDPVLRHCEPRHWLQPDRGWDAGDLEMTGCGQALLSVQALSIAQVDRERIIGTVLKDVSFSIGYREALGVVGESGCGKSTLAMAVMGYLGDGRRITEGT